MAKFKKTKKKKNEGMWRSQKSLSYTADGGVNWFTHFGKLFDNIF